jgi:hypothetical protein
MLSLPGFVEKEALRRGSQSVSKNSISACHVPTRGIRSVSLRFDLAHYEVMIRKAWTEP